MKKCFIRRGGGSKRGFEKEGDFSCGRRCPPQADAKSRFRRMKKMIVKSKLLRVEGDRFKIVSLDFEIKDFLKIRQIGRAHV